MKSDLIILKYKTENVIGTKSSYDTKTFFGSKMIDIEDSIMIDNSYIQYSEVYDISDKKNNGFQYYIDVDNLEKQYLIYLDDLKNSNSSISLVSQPLIDLSINTQWLLKINWKNILIEYLFYRLKESRVFKSIKYTDLLTENINYFIHKYIENNLINRYQFTNIDLYIEYSDLDQQDKDIDAKLSYNPIYDPSIKSSVNVISNVNLTELIDTLNINYKQTDSSKNKMFKYYFDLYITRI